MTATVSRANAAESLQVKLAANIPTIFLNVFGVNTIRVSRTAIATYLAPIRLGQPGSQIGSTVSALGTPGTNSFYFLRTEGWSTPRSEGDAYTPNPGTSSDVHYISAAAGNEFTDSSLPDRGGYNFQVYLPAGGQIRIYNAVFAPDGRSGKPHNYAENKAGWGITNTNGSNYYLHEDDSWNWSGGTTWYAAMRYTVFQVNNLFDRTSDVKLSQMTVLPIDASNWNAPNNQYLDVEHNANITQQWDGNGNPTNMAVYHSWISATGYDGSGDAAPGQPSLVQWDQGPIDQVLPPGTYRLRVDTLNHDGSLPPGGSHAHKALAVRLLDSAGNPCEASANPCGLGAWSDLGVYTPVTGTSFSTPVFQLPPSYSGQTIDVDIYDPGEHQRQWWFRVHGHRRSVRERGERRHGLRSRLVAGGPSQLGAVRMPAHICRWRHPVQSALSRQQRRPCHLHQQQPGAGPVQRSVGAGRDPDPGELLSRDLP